MKGIEDETVARARDGDLEAFRSLVEHHSRDVFRLAFRMTRNEMDAEDAVQETFLRAYKKLSSFDGRASFSTWLYRVTANTSIDVLRRRRRDDSRSSSLDDDTVYAPEPASHSPAPDRLLFNREVKERLRGALDELSELERAAFVMRHFENFSLEEIGSALGLRTSATKQAVFRAVKKVRRTLEPVVRATS
jgi:RNA polymerase sigma-70 factor (ECF subfamily)